MAMAAHNNFIRVRLEFDYPPPAMADCRMCWLLVDLNTCRVVADLESVIRDKFDFSRRSILNLFVQSCYLPHTESALVLRDDDCVRVKVEYLDLVNGDSRHPEKTSKSSRKRRRPTEEHRPEENEVSMKWKKKRRVEKQEVTQAPEEGKKKKLQGKKKEKKKKKTKKKDKSAPSTKNTPVRVVPPVEKKKSPVAQHISSSDSSSSSSEEEAPPKPAPRAPSSTPASSLKQNPTKQRPPPSSSSSSETSSDEAATTKPTSQKQTPTSTTRNPGPNDARTSQPTPPAEPPRDTTSGTLEASKPCASGSEDEIEFVIRKPVHPPGFGVGGPSPWRGFGRRGGKNGRDGAAPRGRGGTRGGFRGANGSFGEDGGTKPSYQTDSLTNTSVVVQNKTEAAPANYSSMPLLAAPPPVGQRIAFKLLELTENYTPEVSEYKEGKIVSFDHATKQIELELQAVSQAPVEPGKFDLVYQNPDGTERVEYAVSRDARVVERWDCLLEPRLII